MNGPNQNQNADASLRTSSSRASWLRVEFEASREWPELEPKCRCLAESLEFANQLAQGRVRGIL